MELEKVVNNSFINSRGRICRSNACNKTSVVALLPVQRTQLRTAWKVGPMVGQPSGYHDLIQPRVPCENQTYWYNSTLYMRSCRSWDIRTQTHTFEREPCWHLHQGAAKTITPGFDEQAGSIACPRGSVVMKYCSVWAIAQPLAQLSWSHVIHMMITLRYLVSQRTFFYLVLHSSKYYSYMYISLRFRGTITWTNSIISSILCIYSQEVMSPERP